MEECCKNYVIAFVLLIFAGAMGVATWAVLVFIGAGGTGILFVTIPVGLMALAQSCTFACCGDMQNEQRASDYV